MPLLDNMICEKQANIAGEVFSAGTHWIELPCDKIFIQEVIPEGFKAPTVPEGENSRVKKRNFSQRFDPNWKVHPLLKRMLQVSK